jgi:hypothetical protein
LCLYDAHPFNRLHNAHPFNRSTSATRRAATLLHTLLANTAPTPQAHDLQRRQDRLRTFRFFVLDNSLRETTVAATRGHTLADKRRIMELVRGCGPGMADTIVGTFWGTHQVDDVFASEAVQQHGPAHLFAFSEVSDRVIGGIPDETLPLGMSKCHRYGIEHIIIECDINCKQTNWAMIGVPGYCALIRRRLEWVHTYLAAGARVFINYRDFPEAVQVVTARLAEITVYLAGLPPSLRPEGLVFEDPSGESMPSTLAAQVAMVRGVMDSHGWAGGHFLVHVHAAYGLSEAVVLECLAAGATGVWCGICREGAGVGHACSLVTLTNLARLGNVWVKQDYNLPALRQAAIEVTRIVTGSEPHPTTEVYGSRALVSVCAL